MRGLGLLLLGVVACVFFSACGKHSVPQAAVPAVAVHPCDASAPDPFGVQAARLTESPIATAGQAGVAPAPSPTTSASAAGAEGRPGCVGPDFSQRCPLWANIEYDHGSGTDIGCGSTIGQCGCAMTSAASLLMHYGVTQGPDGTPTTPQSLNDWFKLDTRQTAAGPISQGYVYGGVNWLAVADYSKLAAGKFNTPSLTYAGNLSANLGGLKSELDNGRPVVLEQPRHFILATGEKSSEVTIADPYYPDRTALDTPAYHNSFLSGRLYRPGSDMSAVMVAAPKGVKFAINDPSGAATGYKSGQVTPVSEVKQSQFSLEAAWQDPTCTVGPPSDDTGVGESVLLLPPAAHYGIDIQGAPQSNFSFAVYAYDQVGGLVLQTFDGSLPASGTLHYDLDYSPAPGSKQVITPPSSGTPPPVPTTPPAPRPNPTPRPASASSTPGSSGPSAPQAPTATSVPATATTAATPRPTATPAPTSTPTPGPAAHLKVTLDPTTLVCTDIYSYATITIAATDSTGKAAQSTLVNLSTSRGSIEPTPVYTDTSGSVTSRVFPGPNPASASVVITVTASAPGGLTASASLTCETPTPSIF